MALRFLANHCVPNSIIEALRKPNHEVLPLRDLLPVDSADAIVIAKAQEIEAILLSLNGDFADIVTYPPKSYKGIVAIQLRNHPEALPHLMAGSLRISKRNLPWSITMANYLLSKLAASAFASEPGRMVATNVTATNV